MCTISWLVWGVLRAKQGLIFNFSNNFLPPLCWAKGSVVKALNLASGFGHTFSKKTHFWVQNRYFLLKSQKMNLFGDRILCCKTVTESERSLIDAESLFSKRLQMLPKWAVKYIIVKLDKKLALRAKITNALELNSSKTFFIAHLEHKRIKDHCAKIQIHMFCRFREIAMNESVSGSWLLYL